MRKWMDEWIKYNAKEKSDYSSETQEKMKQTLKMMKKLEELEIIGKSSISRNTCTCL